MTGLSDELAGILGAPVMAALNEDMEHAALDLAEPAVSTCWRPGTCWRTRP